jgi:two-component system response regulator YesN
MKLIKYKSVLKTYALFFFLVLIIPMFIISIFFVGNSNRMLREKSLTDKKMQMNLFTDNINRQINNIVTCANRMAISTNIYKYRMSLPEIYGPYIINDLRTNVFSSEITSDIYVFSTELTYAYSSSSTYSMDRFIAKMTNSAMSFEDYADFLKTINSDKTVVVYQKDVILLYFHFPVSDTSSNTFIVFEINKALLKEYIRSFSLTRDLLFYINNYDTENFSPNHEIYHNPISPELFKELSQSLKAYDGDGTQEVMLTTDTDHGKYTVLTDYEPITGWNYYYIIPEDDIVSAFSQIQNRTYLVITLVLLCGNILVLLFTYMTYQPIKSLKNTLELLAARDEKNAPPVKNELKAIEQIARNLHSSAKEFSSLEGMSKIALKQFVIQKLIKGTVIDYGAVKINLARLGLFVENDFYFVATLYIAGENLDYDRYTEYLEHYSDEDDKIIYAVHGLEKGQIILIITVPDDDISNYRTFIELLHQDFTGHFHIRATVGVGLVYPDLTQLSVSYMQSVMAYEYRLIKDYNQVLIFSVRRSSFHMDNKYLNMLNFFEKAISTYHREEVKLTLSLIVEFVSGECLSLYSTRYICQNLIQIAASAFYLFPLPVASDFHMADNIDKVNAIETMEEFKLFIDELYQEVHICIEKYLVLSSDTNAKKSTDGRQDLAKIIADYIDGNIADNQLSIMGVAEQFGLSTSYVSRIFKEKYGITILEYINRNRISLAQQLLTTTEKTLETIVMEVGYFDTSSFIRKFKKAVGTTPGEYRKQEWLNHDLIYSRDTIAGSMENTLGLSSK